MAGLRRRTISIKTSEVNEAGKDWDFEDSVKKVVWAIKQSKLKGDRNRIWFEDKLLNIDELDYRT